MAEWRQRDERASSAKTLQGELEALRAALRQAREEMEGLRRMGAEEGEIAKLGSVVARICDSITRALLAQQRLEGQGEVSARVRAEWDRVLRAMGLGEL